MIERFFYYELKRKEKKNIKQLRNDVKGDEDEIWAQRRNEQLFVIVCFIFRLQVKLLGNK